MSSKTLRFIQMIHYRSQYCDHLGNTWLKFFLHFQLNDESRVYWSLEPASFTRISSLSAGAVDWWMMAGHITPDATLESLFTVCQFQKSEDFWLILYLGYQNKCLRTPRQKLPTSPWTFNNVISALLCKENTLLWLYLVQRKWNVFPHNLTNSDQKVERSFSS